MITIDNQGKNNCISVHPAYQKHYCYLSIQGDDNEVLLAEPEFDAPINTVSICLFGHKNRIYIGSIGGNGLTIHAVSGFTCLIGNHSRFHGVFVATSEVSEIQIGEDCEFGTIIKPVSPGQYNIKILPCDHHRVFSQGKRINEPEPIIIGNKVRIGNEAIVLKGSLLEDGCVVATGTVVAGRVPGRSVVAGNPATVIQSDVDWSVIS